MPGDWQRECEEIDNARGLAEGESKRSRGTAEGDGGQIDNGSGLAAGQRERARGPAESVYTYSAVQQQQQGHQFYRDGQGGGWNGGGTAHGQWVWEPHGGGFGEQQQELEMVLHQPFLSPQQQQHHQQPQHLVSDVREAANRAELQKKWQRIDDIREKVERLQEQMIADLTTQRDAEKSARLAAERKITELEAAAAAVRIQQDAARFQAEAEEAARLEVGVPEAATAVETRGDGGHLALQCTLGSGEKAARLQAESTVEESSLEPAGLLFHRFLEDIAVEETTPLQTRGSSGTRNADDRHGTGIVSGDGGYSGDVDGPVIAAATAAGTETRVIGPTTAATTGAPTGAGLLTAASD
ncbi:unnamed protein product, partial [Pylaiella littoralis]